MGCEQVWRQKWHEIGNGITQDVILKIFQIMILRCFCIEIGVRRVLPNPRHTFRTTRGQGWAVSWDTIFLHYRIVLKTARWWNCDILLCLYLHTNFWCSRSRSSINIFIFCKKNWKNIFFFNVFKEIPSVYVVTFFFLNSKKHFMEFTCHLQIAPSSRVLDGFWCF